MFMTNEDYKEQPATKSKKNGKVAISTLPSSARYVATRNLPGRIREATEMMGFDIISDGGEERTYHGVKVTVFGLVEEHFDDYDSLEENLDNPRSSSKDRYFVSKRGN